MYALSIQRVASNGIANQTLRQHGLHAIHVGATPHGRHVDSKVHQTGMTYCWGQLDWARLIWQGAG